MARSPLLRWGPYLLACSRMTIPIRSWRIPNTPASSTNEGAPLGITNSGSWLVGKEEPQAGDQEDVPPPAAHDALPADRQEPCQKPDREQHQLNGTQRAARLGYGCGVPCASGLAMAFHCGLRGWKIRAGRLAGRYRVRYDAEPRDLSFLGNAVDRAQPRSPWRYRPVLVDFIVPGSPPKPRRYAREVGRTSCATRPR